MSYAAGELAALTLIRALTDYTFNEHNSLSTANDDVNAAFSLINNGKSYIYVFLEPSGFASERTGIGQNLDETRWQTIVRIVCFKNPKTGESPIMVLTAVREAIKAKLDTYMELDAANVSYAKIVSGGLVETTTARREGLKKGSPFVMQELILEWEEITALNQLDG